MWYVFVSKDEYSECTGYYEHYKIPENGWRNPKEFDTFAEAEYYAKEWELDPNVIHVTKDKHFPRID